MHELRQAVNCQSFQRMTVLEYRRPQDFDVLVIVANLKIFECPDGVDEVHAGVSTSKAGRPRLKSPWSNRSLAS